MKAMNGQARIRRLIAAARLVSQYVPDFIVNQAIISLLLGLCPLAIAWIGKGLIDEVIKASHDKPADTGWLGYQNILLLALAECGLVICQRALIRWQKLSKQKAGAKLSLELRVLMLRKIGASEYVNFELPQFHDRLQRARQEANNRPLQILQSGFDCCRGLLSFVAFIIVVLQYSPWMALIMMLSTLPSFALEIRHSKQEFELKNRRTAQTRRTSYFEQVLSNARDAKEVRLLNLSEMFLQRFVSLSQQLSDELIDTARRHSVGEIATMVVSTALSYYCFLLVGLDAARGLITVGAMTLYLAAFRQGHQNLILAMSSLENLYQDSINLSSLFEFLDAKALPPAQTASSSARPQAERGIRFVDVGYQYPNAKDWALRHVSLFVPEGESIGLVGRNGSGKSTLVKLLVRLYRPTEGRILVDGVDLATLDDKEWYRRLAVVFQDFSTYELQLREVIALGDLDLSDNALEIERAAAASGADEILKSKGIDAQLGRSVPGGIELSGGQWQRLALARALMRTRAGVFVFDEPTAALDPIIEADIMRRTRELAVGRTMITISHRLAHVRELDCIHVLERGRLVESGRHAELIARSGHYSLLYSTQSAGYTETRPAGQEAAFGPALAAVGGVDGMVKQPA